MRNLTLALSLSFSLASAGAVFAKGGTPQNHHCMKDGAELTGKTRKECKKEGGKWEKMSGAEKGAADKADKGAADKAPAEKAPAPATPPAAPKGTAK
jgi:hypothetical protein